VLLRNGRYGMDSSSLLRQLETLTREEFQAFFASGAFTGFTEQDMGQANEADRGKMEMFNETLRLNSEAKRLMERRRNLGQ
jgi:hypothetical protein